MSTKNGWHGFQSSNIQIGRHNKTDKSAYNHDRVSKYVFIGVEGKNRYFIL